MIPGRPFWAAFTAFAANMTALLTVSAVDLDWLGINAELLASLVISLFVAAVVYGEAKLADYNGKETPVSKWQGTYWVATLERVVGTFLATLVTALGLDQLNAVVSDWQAALGIAGTAAGVTLVKCVLANITSSSGPGFGQAEVLQPAGVTPNA